MIGTIVNACAIIAGSIAGSLLNRGIPERYKQGIYTALGLCSFAIGLNATVTHLPKSEYPVLFVVSMSLGALAGTWLNLHARFQRFVRRLGRRRKRLVAEAGTANLADGLSTAILLYCIGPLAMLGPVISALKGDHTFLYTNATLDLVSSIVFASTYGIGMVLAAPVLFAWQGLFYLIAKISSSAISEALMAELLIVGGMLIMASGLTLMRIKDCKPLNLLPALLVPVAWFLIASLIGL